MEGVGIALLIVHRWKCNLLLAHVLAWCNSKHEDEYYPRSRNSIVIEPHDLTLCDSTLSKYLMQLNIALEIMPCMMGTIIFWRSWRLSLSSLTKTIWVRLTPNGEKCCFPALEPLCWLRLILVKNWDWCFVICHWRWPSVLWYQVWTVMDVEDDFAAGCYSSALVVCIYRHCNKNTRNILECTVGAISFNYRRCLESNIY